MKAFDREHPDRRSDILLLLQRRDDFRNGRSGGGSRGATGYIYPSDQRLCGESAAGFESRITYVPREFQGRVGWAAEDQKLTRGSKGAHFSEGGYGRIAAKVFKRLDVDAFYVSGGSACLGYVA